MISASVNIRSLRQVERNLQAFQEKIDRSSKRTALQKAARPMLRGAKANVAKRYGHLKKALIVKLRTYKRRREVIAYVGPKRGYKAEGPRGERIWPVLYAHLVEFGTSHSAPKPFMRPAFEGNKDEVFDIYATEIRKDIKRFAKRFDKKYR